MKLTLTIALSLLLTNSILAQCWESVSAGYSHNLAIAYDGTLWGWGYNHFGELGNGTMTEATSPILLSADTDWVKVSSGTGPTTVSLGLKDNGTLWAWGNNQFGQVGNGTNDNQLSPVQVGTATDWATMSAGYSHSVAIKTDGTLWLWGHGTAYGDGVHRDTPTQIGTANNWQSVAAGERWTVALKTDGTVWGWGYNSGNPLGINGNPTNVATPTQRSYNSTNVRATSAGDTHSFDVKNDNLLVFWGSNVYNQSGGTTCAGCPTYYVDDFDCGDNSNAIIKTDGTLWFSGVILGYDEPTVQYVTEFTQLGTSNNWVSVSVGDENGAVIDAAGNIWTWGWNYYGQLGIGTSEGRSLTLVPVACPFCEVYGTDTQVVCDSLVWIDGNTYTTSNNTATHTLIDASSAGCDSIVTLDLTVTGPAMGTDFQLACDLFVWIDGNTYDYPNSTATHTLPNASVNGCDSIVTLNLDFAYLDLLVLVSAGDLYSADDNANYQWLDCNDNYAPVPDAVGQLFVPTYTSEYAVELTKNGCVDTSYCYLFTVVGIVENSFDDPLSVFPNPTSGDLKIDLGREYEDVQIKVTDLSGRLVATEVFGRERLLDFYLDVPAGFYWLVIAAEGRKAVVRVLRQ